MPSPIATNETDSSSQYQDEDDSKKVSPPTDLENQEELQKGSKAPAKANPHYKNEISSYWESEFTRASILGENDTVAVAAAAAVRASVPSATSAVVSLEDSVANASTKSSPDAKLDFSGTAVDDDLDPSSPEAVQRSNLSSEEDSKPAAARPRPDYQKGIAAYWEAKFTRSSILGNTNVAADAAKIQSTTMSNETTTCSSPAFPVIKNTSSDATDSTPRAAGLSGVEEDQDENNRARHVNIPEISKPGAYAESGFPPEAGMRKINSSAGEEDLSELVCPEALLAAVKPSAMSNTTPTSPSSSIRRPPSVYSFSRSFSNDDSVKNRVRLSLPVREDGLPASMPGAYAEEGILHEAGEASRRSSAVEEVLAALGEDAPSVELGNERRRSISMSMRGITRSSTSPRRRVSTHSQINDNKQFSGTTATETSLVDAELVDEEAIVYARDVRLDFWKRNQMVLIAFGVLLCALAISLSVVLIQDDEPRTGDPRCWVPIEDQLVHVRCFCSNSTHEAYEELSDDGKLTYSTMQADLTEHAFLEPNATLDSESCESFNQLLLLASNMQAFNVSSELFRDAPLEARNAATVLALVYITMGGLRWIRQDGWVASNILCDWFGVECLFIDIVHHLALPNNALEGTIPTQLGLLQSFRTLDLSSNTNITGTIPSELAGMSNLNSLRLSELSLTGVIPSELGALDRLDSLSLSRNQLTGDLPVDLFSLKELRFLDLGHNAFKGAIPSELGRATNLRGLRLQGNGFTGTLPETLRQLTDLEILNIGNIQLDGPIPAWIGTLPRLQLINLDQSGLTGAIPDSFCTATAPLVVLVTCATTSPCSCCSKEPGSNQVHMRCVEDLPLYAIGLDI
jgi:hypothetical protein